MIVSTILIGAVVSRADIGVVTTNGQQLASYLNSFQVQYWWPTIPVNWQTGSANTPTPPSPNTTLTGTHCSDFTTAVAWPLGIYILRPPIYPDGWNDMANYQDLWFKTNNETPYGWLTISNSSTNMIQAQDLANQGNLVIACYLNPDINDSGHTAVIFPYSNTVANIEAVGPEECQAGTYNYNLTNVEQGFSEHPGAFPTNIDYFYHPVTYLITPVNPVLSDVLVTNGTLSCQVSSLVGRNYNLQTSTDFNNWTTILSYVNPNNLTTLFTTTNLSVPTSQTCLFGVRVSDPYGITSQVVTQDIEYTGIILNGPSITNINLGSAFVDPGASAIEDCATELPVTNSGVVNPDVPGSYTLTYTTTSLEGNLLSATRTVNVIGFLLSYETSLTTSSWSENFDELGNTTNSPLPAGWVFAQGTFMPVYNSPLDAPNVFSTSDPYSWTTGGLTNDQNSTLFTRCSDATTNATLTSGGRVNCGDASTGNINRAPGFATSNPSWESPTNYLMFGFVNDVATNGIAGLSLNYNIKRYKQGTNYPSGAAFYYSTNGTTWIPDSSGDVGPYPASNTTTNYLFTTAPEVSNVVLTISGLDVPYRSPVYLCWQFIISGATGGPSLSENILALDDFNLVVSNAPPPPPPPNLESAYIDAEGNFDFIWGTASGTSYQVQFCTDLNQPFWINYGAPLTATNSTLLFSDPPAPDVYQRFYRILQVSP